MKPKPYQLERIFNAKRADVWRALTEKDLMKQWYFDLAEFKAEVGFAFEFYGGKEGCEQYLHHCEILEVIPERKLTHSWSYNGYAGISYLTFELFDEGENTILKLTHEGLESFPTSNPDFEIHNFVAGWTQLINVSLKEFLEG
ncbi:MAG: SRPBCC domain-containing protein [Saprospiraceae bacterium]